MQCGNMKNMSNSKDGYNSHNDTSNTNFNGISYSNNRDDTCNGSKTNHTDNVYAHAKTKTQTQTKKPD